MSNNLYIDHVEVRYLKDDRRAFGILLHDDFECCNVLDFADEADVPTAIRGIVELCREEYYVNAIDLLERCAEEGHPCLLNGVPVDRVELAAVLAEGCDD